MPRIFGATRLAIAGYNPSWATALARLLVASVALLAAFTPAAGCDWPAQARNSGEEEDSRQLLEEEIQGALAPSSSRPQRTMRPSNRAAARVLSSPKRQSADNTPRAALAVEMIRRNGTGSVLRC